MLYYPCEVITLLHLSCRFRRTFLVLRQKVTGPFSDMLIVSELHIAKRLFDSLTIPLSAQHDHFDEFVE